MKKIDEKLDTIISSFSQMTGGKRALFGLCTLIGIAIGAVVGVVTVVRFWKGA